MMPHRTLRFCPTCVLTQHAAAREACGTCGDSLRPLLDEDGALSRDFLFARGTCCDSGCRNCPFGARVAEACTAVGGCRKACGRCGAEFDCCKQGCWCEDVALSAATLEQLQRSYTDCLCPACLATFSAA